MKALPAIQMAKINPSIDGAEPTSVTDSRHGHSAAQKHPEHNGTYWFLAAFREEVELGRLHWSHDL